MTFQKESECQIPFPLTHIYFYLTSACNLACRHCYLNPKLQNKTNTYPMLELEHFKSIIQQGKTLGLKTVKLTGGEPLMHPHIDEMLKTVKQESLSLCVETNGVLCTPELAEKIASCRGRSVSVSLDGTDAETHEYIRGVKGCFAAAIKGIQNLVRAGVRPQIIISIMQSNKHQLMELVRLAEALNASSIKLGIVNPSGRGETLIDGGETLSVEELLELGHWIKETLVPSTKLSLSFAIPVAFRNLSDIYGPRGSGCSTCSFRSMIGVLANGSYVLCGIGTNVKEFVMGDVTSDRLEDVWKNNCILNELRGDVYSRYEGICAKCHMKRLCSAFCMAQNYYLTGSLYKSFWFCDEAYKKGLFPASRIAPN